MINEFTVEAVDLGELKKLRIGHDNSGVCGLRLISHSLVTVSNKHAGGILASTSCI